jgi:hypothetical protein
LPDRSAISGPGGAPSRPGLAVFIFLLRSVGFPPLRRPVWGSHSWPRHRPDSSNNCSSTIIFQFHWILRFPMMASAILRICSLLCLLSRCNCRTSCLSQARRNRNIGKREG